MGSCSSGGKAVSPATQSLQPSPLQITRENYSQFQAALQEGKRRGASVIKYEGAYGTVTRYWNGAAYVDRKSALYEDKYVKGVYEAKFKDPFK